MIKDRSDREIKIGDILVLDSSYIVMARGFTPRDYVQYISVCNGKCYPGCQRSWRSHWFKLEDNWLIDLPGSAQTINALMQIRQEVIDGTWKKKK